jgi:hypothetical protein
MLEDAKRYGINRDGDLFYKMEKWEEYGKY